MKSYTLKFKKADFVSTTNGVWRTAVIDLYDNAQYKNYSVRRSNYGTDLLGNGIYTGVSQESATTTEIGYITGGRFVDLSGQIDIVGWTVDVENIGSSLSTQQPTCSLNVYNGPQSAPYEHASPGMWAIQNNIRLTGTIYMINAQRYSYFELVFDTLGMSAADFNTYINNFDITFWVRVEIESPTIDAFFSRTGNMLNRFPQWMDINETDPTDPSYLQMSTPTSLGGKFLNAIAGEWLTDLHTQINYQSTQYYIDTVDLSQKAWVYRTSSIGGLIHTITGDGVPLAATSNVGEFHATVAADNAYFWNTVSDEIYTNVRYEDLQINGANVPQELYHIWNCVDDLGTVVDLRRHQQETNESFRNRVRDVYINRPGVALEAFKKAVRRELNLWQFWSNDGIYQDGASTPSGATPNSYFVGATPSVLEMPDVETDEMYFDDRGNPTQRFKALIEELAINYPITWGYFRYGEAFWDPDGLLHKGLGYLPKIFDATPLTSDVVDSGVGDGNDLFLFRPDVKSQQVQFNTGLKIRGRVRNDRVEYQPVAMNVAIYGQADMVIYDNPAFTGWFTIEIVVGGVTYFSPVEVTTYSDVAATPATPSAASHAVIEWHNAPGATPSSFTSSNFIFYNKTTGAIYGTEDATPSNLVKIKDITSVTIRAGRWNTTLATPAYDNVPTQSQYRAFFRDTTSPILGFGGSATSITRSPFNHANAEGTFEVQSLLTSSSNVVDGFQTEKHEYTVLMNDANPPTTQQNYILDVPPMLFPTAATNQEIIVEIESANSEVFGAYSTDEAATPFFVPASLVAVNGDATWTAGKKSFSTSTSTLEFSTNTSITIPEWSVFEASMTPPISGIVDINGPWRENQRPPETNTSNVLEHFTNLDRSDFGIPHTSNYIITWIGVDSVSSPDVTVWIDSNTVQPAVTYEGESDIQIEYPDNAVVESLIGGVYVFSSFAIYARLSPQVNEKWLPSVHSGWFYDDEQEYYLYASPNTIITGSTPIVIQGINRQGAPILVEGMNAGSTPFYDMRQIANFYMDSNATPATPYYSLVHSETKSGSGNNTMYVAYDNIYDIAVRDLTLNVAATPVTTSSISNIVTLNQSTSQAHEYEITYKARKSFYIEQVNDNTRMKVVFDNSGYPKYRVTYETSLFDPATPIDIPLNTLHTSIDEGFIYIDHDIRSLDRVEINFSPARVVADTIDYGLVVVRTFDNVGNPKPFVQVNLYTNFGTLSSSTVTTDTTGFAYATLTTELWDGALSPSPSTPSLTAPGPSNGYRGRILAVVTGSNYKQSQAFYEIQLLPPPTNIMMAMPLSDAVLADGDSANTIHGRIQNASRQPIRNALVYWRKGRYVYDVLTGTRPALTPANIGATPGTGRTSGYVTTNSAGRFTIEPFISKDEPGYWFVATESSGYVQYEGATPKWSEVYASFNGSSGYLTFPDQAALDITGDITVVARINPNDWTPATANSIAARWYTGSLSWAFRLGVTGALQFFTSVDGSATTTTHTSSTTLSAQPLGWLWVAVTFDAVDGANRTTRFWTSPNGTTWTILGTAQSTAGNTTIFNPTTGFDIGAVDGGLSQIFDGKIQHVSVRNGIGASGVVGGTEVFHFDETNLFGLSSDARTFTVTTGQTATAGGSVVLYTGATPNAFAPVGDVVTWYEYPNVNAALDPITNIPLGNNQDATPFWELPNYTFGSKYPVNYDESSKDGAASSATPPWLPPAWYAIDRYRQYQMGLSGTGYHVIGATPAYPDYKEF